MGRPRYHPFRNTLAALTVAGAVCLAASAPAFATPWQQAWGDYDSQQQWHDAGWWLQNRHDWVISHHPEWTENYAATRGQIGDSDSMHARHYGDGGYDRIVKANEKANAKAIEAAKNEWRKAHVTSPAS
jgi:hypothetical protein